MSRHTVWLLPWRGPLLARGARAAVMIALVIGIAATVLVHVVQPRWPNGWLAATMVVAVWLAGVGVLLGSMVRIAWEAQSLRLPGVAVAVGRSVWLNGLLALALTAVPLTMLSAHPAPIFDMLVIALVAGVAYAVLPVLWVMVGALLFSLQSALPARLGGGAWMPLEPHFGMACALFVTAALLLSWWRWGALLRHCPQPLPWWNRSVGLALALRGCGIASMACCAGSDGRRSGPSDPPRWLTRQVALRAAGPADLARALRVALGGAYLPLTTRCLMRRFGGPTVLLAALMLLGLPMLIRTVDRATLLAVAQLVAIFALGLAVMIGALMRAAQVQRRWGLRGGERALLALLPRCGAPEAQSRCLRRVLLAHSLVRPLPLILAAMLIEALATRQLQRTLLLGGVLALAPLGETAVIYAVLGRIAIPPWGYGVMLAVGQIVLVGGLNVSTFPDGHVLAGLQGVLLAGMMLCYLGWVTVASIGWRALQRAPHPYLGSA
ncbi:MAG: hypothetical protein ACP5P4_01180 [Steroidobacteraceae bacterium]